MSACSGNLFDGDLLGVPLGDGQGGTVSAFQPSPHVFETLGIAAGDFDGDGAQDLCVSADAPASSAPNSDGLWTWLGTCVPYRGDAVDVELTSTVAGLGVPTDPLEPARPGQVLSMALETSDQALHGRFTCLIG